MKYDTGLWIGNTEDTIRKNIVINAKPLNLKDLSIGGGLILAGCLYLVRKSFKNGAIAFSNAECNVMESLGLFVNK